MNALVRPPPPAPFVHTVFVGSVANLHATVFAENSVAEEDNGAGVDLYVSISDIVLYGCTFSPPSSSFNIDTNQGNVNFAGSDCGAGQEGATNSSHVPTTTGNAAYVGIVASYNPGLAGCRACPTTRYSTEPHAHECSLCPAGKSASTTGAVVCDDCPAATYSLEGSDSCTDCTAGKSSITIAAEAENTCSACDTGMTSSPGSTSCYASCDFLEVLVGSICEPCADGAVCDSDNVKVETMAVLPTYWRASNSSNAILKCANQAACTPPTNSTSLCATGHGGPFCELCEDNYALSAGACLSCESGGAASIAPAVLALVLLFAVGWCATAIKDRDETKEAMGLFKKTKKRFKIVFKLLVQYFQVRTARRALHITRFLTHTMCRSSA